MEDCMRDCMRKLALWFTRTFKPLMTHDELEPIMATLGFVARPFSSNEGATSWKEYVHTAEGYWERILVPTDHQLPLPKPRLPYPRIDGLHIYTYRAFLDAVNFYLQMNDISQLFHIRGLPLHKIHDRHKKWHRMEETESVYIYREGTLDQVIYAYYHKNKNDNCCRKGCISKPIRNKGRNVPTGCSVLLEDVIVSS